MSMKLPSCGKIEPIASKGTSRQIYVRLAESNPPSQPCMLFVMVVAVVVKKLYPTLSR